ncbi:ALQxL family class IV lanthipeptide [Streptomyces fimicarius]|nr:MULTISPECIES: ALQxL family class IV lanthipeptide [Streptomyces]MCL6293005.1 ALQxL family class IV lanthipeptide [Streptomyces sp. 43Y-GA-1]MCX4710737.1 ALQxL family class IV lanthipeptide [Streptomyces griseus]MDX3336668.1 ALQxL family class IV lanthipeptide [Streptomyces sp. ME02-6979.5a]MDX3594374.1 ALQxL family class IV lanthipeptide [Streptomyces sp. ID03-2B]
MIDTTMTVDVDELQTLEGEESVALAGCTRTCTWTCSITSIEQQ